MLKKKGIVTVLVLAIAALAIFLMGQVGLEDAQATDEAVTWVSNFVTNLKSDKGIVIMISTGLVAAASLVVPRIVKLVK